MIAHMGWRWIFFSALPIEIAALILTLIHLKGEWKGAVGESFDDDQVFLSSGKRMMNFVPFPGIESAVMVPPWFSVMIK